MIVKNVIIACNVGDPGSIHGSGRSAGEGNGNPLQYSYLENSMDRGAWRATVHGVTKGSDVTQRLKKQANSKPRPLIPHPSVG